MMRLIAVLSRWECSFPILLTSYSCLVLFAGCGSGQDQRLELLPAKGTVTIRGTPLPNATITFLPDNGPLAHGVTDDHGRFGFRTGTRAGAVVGAGKVAVTMATPTSADHHALPSVSPRTPEEQSQYLQRCAEIQRGLTINTHGKRVVNPTIPGYYASPATSGLTCIVTPGNDNDFRFDLAD